MTKTAAAPATLHYIIWWAMSVLRCQLLTTQPIAPLTLLTFVQAPVGHVSCFLNTVLHVLPVKCLSQPHAWLAVHYFKDVSAAIVCLALPVSPILFISIVPIAARYAATVIAQFVTSTTLLIVFAVLVLK